MARSIQNSRNKDYLSVKCLGSIVEGASDAHYIAHILPGCSSVVPIEERKALLDHIELEDISLNFVTRLRKLAQLFDGEVECSEVFFEKFPLKQEFFGELYSVSLARRLETDLRWACGNALRSTVDADLLPEAREYFETGRELWNEAERRVQQGRPLSHSLLVALFLLSHFLLAGCECEVARSWMDAAIRYICTKGLSMEAVIDALADRKFSESLEVEVKIVGEYTNNVFSQHFEERVAPVLYELLKSEEETQQDAGSDGPLRFCGTRGMFVEIGSFTGWRVNETKLLVKKYKDYIYLQTFYVEKIEDEAAKKRETWKKYVAGDVIRPNERCYGEMKGKVEHDVTMNSYKKEEMSLMFATVAPPRGSRDPINFIYLSQSDFFEQPQVEAREPVLEKVCELNNEVRILKGAKMNKRKDFFVDRSAILTSRGAKNFAEIKATGAHKMNEDGQGNIWIKQFAAKMKYWGQMRLGDNVKRLIVLCHQNDRVVQKIDMDFEKMTELMEGQEHRFSQTLSSILGELRQQLERKADGFYEADLKYNKNFGWDTVVTISDYEFPFWALPPNSDVPSFDR